MKSKIQKSEELEKGRKLLKDSRVVLLIDFSKVKTADLRNLRQELKKSGNPLLIIKKRLLGLLLKDKNIEFKNADFKMPMGAVFASDLESASASVYKFFQGLVMERKIDKMRMLGGYDVAAGSFISAEQAVFIGKLPSREVLLGQLLGMIAAPIRSFLYVLSEKSRMASSVEPSK